MAHAMTNLQTRGRTVRVWDIAVRVFHWSLVAVVGLAFLTEDARSFHEVVGYAAVALVGFRLIWGLIGPRHARFSGFVPSPRRFVAYMRDMKEGREKRYLGHNPAGGAMVVALLITLSLVGVTGYYAAAQGISGVRWVGELHEGFVNILVGLIGLHIAGVVLASFRHSENLVIAMITGQKEVDDDHPDQ